MGIKKDTLNVEGLEIGIYTEDFKNEYMSLTDMARYRNGDDPRFVIQNWMRNKDTIEFLAVWETLHNPDFNRRSSECRDEKLFSIYAESCLRSTKLTVCNSRRLDPKLAQTVS